MRLFAYTLLSITLSYFLFISCGTEPYNLPPGISPPPPGVSPNGVTIKCPFTKPGDVFVIDSVEYVSVDNEL